jgi:uncharacterized protein YbaR (Trm112 family)
VKNPNEFGARNLDFSHAALPCKKTGSQHFNILVCPICKLEFVSYARRAVELRRSATADALCTVCDHRGTEVSRHGCCRCSLVWMGFAQQVVRR